MKRALWTVWWLAVVVWTVALTTTFPVHIKETVMPVDPAGIHVAKVLHFCAYAFLAAFSLWLRPPVVWRWLIVLLLLEHGVATEWVQGFVPERTPRVDDVVIDHLGVALGVVLSWPWRRTPG